MSADDVLKFERGSNLDASSRAPLPGAQQSRASALPVELGGGPR